MFCRIAATVSVFALLAVNACNEPGDYGVRASIPPSGLDRSTEMFEQLEAEMARRDYTVNEDIEATSRLFDCWDRSAAREKTIRWGREEGRKLSSFPTPSHKRIPRSESTRTGMESHGSRRIIPRQQAKWSTASGSATKTGRRCRAPRSSMSSSMAGGTSRSRVPVIPTS